MSHISLSRSLHMAKQHCFCCDEVGYVDEGDFGECAVCDNQFLIPCLSEEGEDGMLCGECGTDCITCGTTVNKEKQDSEHYDTCVECRVVSCPFDRNMTMCLFCRHKVCNEHYDTHNCQ